MLTEICAGLHNWFCQDADKHFGTFKISGGVIAPLDFLQEGQYFRVIGSVFNDGVYKHPVSGLIDESFDGAVWAMRVPPAVVKLTDEITAFVESSEGKPSPYVSESFGGYSYSKATDKNGVAAGWQTVFASRLNKWRKV